MKEIVRLLLRNRSASRPTLNGDVREALGPENLAKALEARWVIPDYDSGGLLITTDLGRLAEMEKLAEGEDYQVGHAVVTVGPDGRPITAHVKEVLPDGTIKLSFGDNKPERVVKRGEVRRADDREAESGKPTNPTPSATPTTPTSQPVRVLPQGVSASPVVP